MKQYTEAEFAIIGKYEILARSIKTRHEAVEYNLQTASRLLTYFHPEEGVIWERDAQDRQVLKQYLQQSLVQLESIEKDAEEFIALKQACREINSKD